MFEFFLNINVIIRSIIVILLRFENKYVLDKKYTLMSWLYRMRLDIVQSVNNSLTIK